MLRKLVTAAASAALCLASVTPAFAQQYNYSGFNAPMGATATANLRIPLGHETKKKASYGVSFGFGRTVGAGFDGRPVTRELRLADIRFSGDGKLSEAKLASFDLANLDQDRRMNLTGEGNTLWIVVGLVAAGVAVCLLADCFEGDDDDSVPNSSN